MGIFSPDVWTHCNYIAETFGDMFLTHCDTSVPTFTILPKGERPKARGGLTLLYRGANIRNML